MNNITLGALKEMFLQEDPSLVLPKGLGAPLSYRGYYDQVAFRINSNVPVFQVLEYINQALEFSFLGYKGGNYRYSADTPVWCVCSASDSGDECILTEAHVRTWIEEAKERRSPKLEEVGPDRCALHVSIRKPYSKYVTEAAERKEISYGRLIELALALYQKHEAGLLIDTSLPGGCMGDE